MLLRGVFVTVHKRPHTETEKMCMPHTRTKADISGLLATSSLGQFHLVSLLHLFSNLQLVCTISDGTVTSLGRTRMPPVQHDVAQSTGTWETYLSVNVAWR